MPRRRMELRALQLGMLNLRKVMRLVPVLVNDLVLRVCELPSQLLRFLLVMCELLSQ